MSGRFVTRFVLRRLAAAVVLPIRDLVRDVRADARGPRPAVAGRGPRTPEVVQGLRETYRLSGSFFERYLSRAGSALHLDFGEPVNSSQDVVDAIAPTR